jgi:anti-sigma B factor antagonist
VVAEPAGPSAVVLTIEGELDMATAPVLRESLTGALDAGATGVVTDLSAVTFMDSVALATILQARRRLGDGSGLAFVSPAGSYTRLILEIAGGVTHLHVFETRDEAVAHVRG